MSPRAGSAYLSWLARVLAPTLPGGGAGHRDLVLGYATGYDADTIAPFVKSLRAVFDGRIALVVDDRSDVSALLAQHGAEALCPQVCDGWRPHPVVQRFAAYAAALADAPETRFALLTDVRDVVFQGSVFEPAPVGIETFVEFEQGRLADHAFNAKYLRAVAGEGLADAIGDRACLCAGTVMGPREALIRLCRVMLMLGSTPRSAVGGAFGADQAALNLAVHYGLVDARIMPNHGRVATIGTGRDAVAVRDGVIVNPDGSVSPIVHQYDRHADTMQAVRDRWDSCAPERRDGEHSLKRLRARLAKSVSTRLPEAR